MKKNKIVFILIAIISVLIACFMAIYILNKDKVNKDNTDIFINAFNRLSSCSTGVSFSTTDKIYYEDLSNDIIVQVVYNYLNKDSNEVLKQINIKDFKKAFKEIFGKKDFDINSIKTISGFNVNINDKYIELTTYASECVNYVDFPSIMNYQIVKEDDTLELYYAKYYTKTVFDDINGTGNKKLVIYTNSNFEGEEYTEEYVHDNANDISDLSKYKIVFTNNVFDYIEPIN